jgi:starvation-inducible DNA-binding protein
MRERWGRYGSKFEGFRRHSQDVHYSVARPLKHEIVLKEARTMERRAAEGVDDGTNDLIVSDVIRRYELQVWSWPSTSSICRR